MVKNTTQEQYYEECVVGPRVKYEEGQEKDGDKGKLQKQRKNPKRKNPQDLDKEIQEKKESSLYLG